MLAHLNISPQLCIMEKTKRQDNQQKWFSRIEDFLSKGQSQVKYCESTGLKKVTFCYWLGKYRSRGADQQAEKNGFIALQPSQQESLTAKERQQVTLRTGEVSLIFSEFPDLDLLIPLIKSLA